MATSEAGEEIRQLIKDLGEMPPELRKQLRPALKSAAEPIVIAARGRASWSSRIPGAIALSVRLSRRNPGVAIVVRKAKAPHGRPFEGITGATTFEHPVFGHRDRVVTQTARPYLEPAVTASTDEVLNAVAQTVDQVARQAGFR